MIKIQPFIDKYFKLKIEYRKRFKLNADLKSPVALFKRSVISAILIIITVLLFSLSFWISLHSMIIAIPIVLAGSSIVSIFNSQNSIDELITKSGFTLLFLGLIAFFIRASVLPDVWFPQFLDHSLYAPIILIIVGCFVTGTGANMDRTQWKENSDEWSWDEN